MDDMTSPDSDKRPSAETPEEERRRLHENILFVILYIIVAGIAVAGFLSIHGGA